MFKSRTTLVVGAGASFELGFPTSEGLKNEIATAVDIKFEHHRQVHGDRQIGQQLRKVADWQEQEKIKEYNDHLHAGWHITNAMPQAISIDNFVEAQQDQRVTTMAKFGIASCLISAEERAWKKFRVSENSHEIRWGDLESTWFHFFFQVLHEGLQRDGINEIFENVRFIIFNYDRSLEFLLSEAIQNYFGTGREAAEKLVDSAVILHPYGQIGRLPFQKEPATPLRFGSGNKGNLFEISKEIVTFSERVEEDDQLGAIRDAVEWADQLIFLGFSYNDTNLKLLAPTDRQKDTQRVIGTAYGLSKPDVEVVQAQLKDVCMITDGAQSLKSGNYIIDNTAKCVDLFSKYRKSIMS